MKLLNYKVKALIALFLFGLSSLVLASPCEEAFSSKEAVAQKTDKSQVELNKTELSNSTSKKRQADSNKKEPSNSISEDISMSRLEQAVRESDFESMLSRGDPRQIPPEEIQRARDLMKAMQEAHEGLDKAVNLFVTINELEAKTEESKQIKDHLINIFNAFMYPELSGFIFGDTPSDRLKQIKQAVDDLDVEYILSKDHKGISHKEFDKALTLIKVIHKIYGKTEESELIESHLSNLHKKSIKSYKIKWLMVFGGFGVAVTHFPFGFEVGQHYFGSGIEDPMPYSEWYIDKIDQIIKLFKGEQVEE